MRQRSEHEQAVKQFFEECQKKDPKRYKEVCDNSPIVTRSKLSSIFKQEITSGLIGLEPCRISASDAYRAGIDSSFSDE